MLGLTTSHEIWNLSHTLVSYIPLSLALLDIVTSVWDNIKIMPCVEGDRSDCQPEASSTARSRRLRAMVVVEG